MAQIRPRLTAKIGGKTDKGTIVTRRQYSAAQAEAIDNVLIKENNAKLIEEAIDRAVAAALEEIGLAAERFAKSETPVDTGRLRNSITHVIAPDEEAVYIGTNVEYAPYVELGVRGREGAKMLTHAAENHGDFYRKIMEKHLKSGG